MKSMLALKTTMFKDHTTIKKKKSIPLKTNEVLKGNNIFIWLVSLFASSENTIQIKLSMCQI